MGGDVSMYLLLAKLSLCGLVIGEDPLTAEQIARMNASGVAAAHSLVVHVQYYQQLPASGGKDHGPKLMTDDYIYTVAGAEERLRLNRVQMKPSPDGDRPGYSDRYNGPSGFKALNNYDAEHPPELGEFSTSSAAGHLAPMQEKRLALGVNAKAQLLLEVGYSVRSWPLRDLVSGAASARVVATPSKSPRGCYELEIRRPEADLPLFAVSVDPSANFMIRRVAWISTATSRPKFDGLMEVKRFKDCGDGAFIPAQIEGEGTENRLTSRQWLTVEILSCNQPLSADALHVRYPDWLKVVDQTTGKVLIMGPDEKLRMSFNTYEDYMKWYEPRYAKAKGLYWTTWTSRGVSWRWLILLNAVLIAAVVVFVARRRARPASD